MAYDRRDDRSRSGNRQGKGGDRHGFRRRYEGDSSQSAHEGRRGRGHHERGWQDGSRGGGAGSGNDGYGRRRGAGGRTGRQEAYGSARAGGTKPTQRPRIPEPPVPSDVAPQDLEASARRELRALGRANADNVARHLVMVQRLLDSDPQTAYQHARYAASHAGRVAVVRESAGIAAYLSGHYNEALREIRAARRLSGRDLHRAIEADCERALGRFNQALKAAQEADPRQLDDLEEAEIAMVVSGVRHDMGHSELGLVVIEEAIMMFRGDRETLRRLHSVRADRLEELGREEEAAKIRERIGFGDDSASSQTVEVYDIEDDYDEQERADQGDSSPAPVDSLDDMAPSGHGSDLVDPGPESGQAGPDGGAFGPDDEDAPAVAVED